MLETKFSNLLGLYVKKEFFNEKQSWIVIFINSILLYISDGMITIPPPSYLANDVTIDEFIIKNVS